VIPDIQDSVSSLPSCIEIATQRVVENRLKMQFMFNKLNRNFNYYQLKINSKNLANGFSRCNVKIEEFAEKLHR
jgi:hypothetical protein